MFLGTGPRGDFLGASGSALERGQAEAALNRWRLAFGLQMAVDERQRLGQDLPQGAHLGQAPAVELVPLAAARVGRQGAVDRLLEQLPERNQPLDALGRLVELEPDLAALAVGPEVERAVR